MPLYEFICPICGYEEERLQSLSDSMPHCNTCFDEIKMVKKISATSFVLKGSGFYKTDYVDKTSDKAK
tara:strand:- start:7540 stop:7743 length:204 start_codon:yes stop_codon:yes gene_type:complete